MSCVPVPFISSFVSCSVRAKALYWLLGSSLILACRMPSVPEIVFVVPDKGAFVIVEEPADGQVSSGELIEIPPDGFVAIADATPLREGFAAKARTSQGQSIPFGNHLPDDADPPVALWMGPVSSTSAHGTRFHFFVGNRREFEEFKFENFLPGVPPP